MRLLIFICIFLAGTSTQVQAEQQELAWDCWIGDKHPVRIYCIHAREGIPPQQMSNMESALLKHIHDRIHQGGTQGLEDLVDKNAGVFRTGSIWNIKIHSYPTENAWQEGRPTLLIRALLCPAGYACTVNLNRE